MACPRCGGKQPMRPASTPSTVRRGSAPVAGGSAVKQNPNRAAITGLRYVPSK